MPLAFEDWEIFASLRGEESRQLDFGNLEVGQNSFCVFEIQLQDEWYLSRMQIGDSEKNIAAFLSSVEAICGTLSGQSDYTNKGVKLRIEAEKFGKFIISGEIGKDFHETEMMNYRRHRSVLNFRFYSELGFVESFCLAFRENLKNTK